MYRVLKATNIGIAAYLNAQHLAPSIPLLGFRPLPEAGALVIELLVLRVYLRRSGEDILLGNLGVATLEFAGVFATLHGLLSLTVHLLA